MPAGIKVLVVDDQPDFLEKISFWLRTKGYDVSTAASGAEGIRLLQKGGFDLVFLDFQMPVMNGLETLAKIREFNAAIPVVLVTAHANEAILREARRYPVAGFFSKLSELDELQRTLDVVLRGLRRLRTGR